VELAETPGPIISLFPKSPSQTHSLKKRLLATGVLPPFVKYPGFSDGYFRFAISSGHSRAQLDKLIKVLKNS
jgi:7-keto-8-aminopelargonate synthetase-like enzyme